MSHPDHFALFALPARFALDEAALERAHKEVQSHVHPDRFAGGSAAERRVAMQWAARANEAYGTLKSPLARAAYLCEQAGVPIDAHSNTAMPAAFLAQQMQWREALDDALAAQAGERPTAAAGAGGGADGSAMKADALTPLEREIEAARGELLAQLHAAIDGRADYPAAAALVRRLMFVEKFRDELRAARSRGPLDRASA